MNTRSLYDLPYSDVFPLTEGSLQSDYTPRNINGLATSDNFSSIATNGNTPVGTDYTKVHNPRDEGHTISMANSEMNISNVFDKKEKSVGAIKFVVQETRESIKTCSGHECLIDTHDINRHILYQPAKRKLKPQFTPPIFAGTGILPCPDVNINQTMEQLPIKKVSSVLDNDKEYLTPGNMEFAEFTYPTIGNSFQYATIAVPKNNEQWKWIYRYIYNTINLFRRKYHCEVYLDKEPLTFRGKLAYSVRIESENQGNILRCRSGLPDVLKDILITPVNATNDINCYVTEYLIKRKFIFKHQDNQNKVEINNSNMDSSTNSVINHKTCSSNKCSWADTTKTNKSGIYQKPIRSNNKAHRVNQNIESKGIY